MKNHGERLATLEAHYVEINESLKGIKEAMVVSNGTIKDLVKFRIQVQAILGFMAFTVSLTAGTLLTLVLTEVL